MLNRRNPCKPIAALMLSLALASACGCGRTVLVPEDAPMRVGPGTTGKAYLLIDGEWTISSQRIAYPEGWYVVPPRFVHPEEFGPEVPPGGRSP